MSLCVVVAVVVEVVVVGTDGGGGEVEHDAWCFELLEGGGAQG